MVKKVFAYLAVFLFSFLIFLVVLTPASFIWERLVAPNVSLRSLGVQVQQVSGSVWDGQALVSYQGVDSILDWNLHISGLLGLELPLQLDVKSHLGTAEAVLSAGLGAAKLNLKSLDANLAVLNDVLSRRRIKLDGELVARNITVQVEDQKIVAAEGAFSWSGGQISYPAGRETHDREVPVFKGQISTREDGMIYLGISDAQSTFDPIEASLLPDGVAMLQVKRRLLDLVDEPWSINSNERDVVFKVKKSIY